MTKRITKNGKDFLIKVSTCAKCGCQFEYYPYLLSDNKTEVCKECSAKENC